MLDDSATMPQKRCTQCDHFFPATPAFFQRDVSHKDGLRSSCKLCTKFRTKVSREAHKEDIRERRKRYQATHRETIAAHKKQWQQGEAYKAYQKRYHQEHKDVISQQSRRRYEARREELCECQRRYLRTEQGRIVGKAHRHKRKAQKRASQGRYTSQELKAQMYRQKSRCYYCKTKLGETWHADHVVPLARGGTNEISNIVIACPACNMHKQARLPHEWFEGGRLL